jgi:hypothetical protein
MNKVDLLPDSIKVTYYDQSLEWLTIYDVAVYESIVTSQNEINANSICISNSFLQKSLVDRKDLERYGYTNTNDDIAFSIGRLILQGHLKMRLNFNRQKIRRVLIPHKRSKLYPRK